MNTPAIPPNSYSVDFASMDTNFLTLVKSMNKNMICSPSLNRDSAIPLKGSASEMKPLLRDFYPGPDDVICGRGKKCYNHIGNLRFRERVESKLDQYSAATSRHDKSEILSSIVNGVRKLSPQGGFVKQDDSGCWYEVGDYLAREKTSQAFRDALHEQYRSSKKAKHDKRRQKGKNKERQVASAFEQMSVELFYKTASRAISANSNLQEEVMRPSFFMPPEQESLHQSNPNNLSLPESSDFDVSDSMDRMNSSLPSHSRRSSLRRQKSFPGCDPMAVSSTNQCMEPLPFDGNMMGKIDTFRKTAPASEWVDAMDCDGPSEVKSSFCRRPRREDSTLKDFQDWEHMEVSEMIDHSSTGSGIVARLHKAFSFAEDDNPFEPIPILAEPEDDEKMKKCFRSGDIFADGSDFALRNVAI